MLAIEAASVVDGEVVGDNLILEKFDGSTINAGNVRGPQGVQGVPGTNGTSYTPHSAGLITNAAVSTNSGTWTRLAAMVADAAYPIVGTKLSIVNNTIRVSEAGIYVCVGAIGFAANASNRRGIAFDNNAVHTAAYANVQHGAVVSTSSSTPTINATNVLNCAANDYIRLWSFQDSGAALNVGGTATTYIKVFKL